MLPLPLLKNGFWSLLDLSFPFGFTRKSLQLTVSLRYLRSLRGFDGHPFAGLRFVIDFSRILKQCNSVANEGVAIKTPKR